MPEDITKLRIPAPEAPAQFDKPQGLTKDLNVDSLIRVVPARDTFEVDGSGLCVAVLDTGLRTTHVDFAGRVVAQKNFTSDNGGNPDDATDGQGHGTNVGGIIVANGVHIGIAPKANIVPIKVLGNTGGGGFDAVENALAWVLENREAFNITVVSMSLGAPTNAADDSDHRDSKLAGLLQALRAQDVPVVIAAGNDYFKFQAQGMGFPAIFREAISVGAVYDVSEGGFRYMSGAEAFSSAPDQITPFSQRLADDPGRPTRTTVFSPGAPVTSAGIANDRAESIQSGTSQATPVVSGVILLLQQLHLRTLGKLPSVDLIIDCLRNSGVQLVDDDRGADNVKHTGATFLRVDAFGALAAMKRALQKQLLNNAMAPAAASISAAR
jgi:subtilisin family serine protease